VKGFPRQWVTVALAETAHSVGPEFHQACRSSTQREEIGAGDRLYLVGGYPGDILISTPETYARGVAELQ